MDGIFKTTGRRPPSRRWSLNGRETDRDGVLVARRSDGRRREMAENTERKKRMKETRSDLVNKSKVRPSAGHRGGFTSTQTINSQSIRQLRLNYAIRGRSLIGRLDDRGEPIGNGRRNAAR